MTTEPIAPDSAAFVVKERARISKEVGNLPPAVWGTINDLEGEARAEYANEIGAKIGIDGPSFEMIAQRVLGSASTKHCFASPYSITSGNGSCDGIPNAECDHCGRAFCEEHGEFSRDVEGVARPDTCERCQIELDLRYGKVSPDRLALYEATASAKGGTR